MTQTARKGDRIAKIIARAGLASRRGAEDIIKSGRVSVNGKPIDSPALNIIDTDQITVDGKPLTKPEPTRLWLYYKPIGVISTNHDEKNRMTIYETLPEDMPRVMSIGRLDINSEGLLLLTNDGELKRKLELPSTGWVRRYRVRTNGRPTDSTLEPLRKGITLDGERFQPMQVTLDRQQGANAWLTIGLREGKNREIRRALESVGLIVNRLIRISFGPFQLSELKPGTTEEVRRRVMHDQLGLDTKEGNDGTATKKKKVIRVQHKTTQKPTAEMNNQKKRRSTQNATVQKPTSDSPNKRPSFSLKSSERRLSDNHKKNKPKGFNQKN
ncbi:MAG: rRNA pseudouridine synthase [Tateyamaria sp.]|nr:rRNA pseudouridine synthase [Tateyamaria sp.]